MPDVLVRDMTADDEPFVGTCARPSPPPEVRAAASRRLTWLAEHHAAGVRVKVALADGLPAGFLYAVPIAICPWGPLGEDLLVLPCLFVRPEAERQGVGGALLAAAEEEARAQGAKGVVTTAHNHEAWFLPVAFFEQRGYEVAQRRGMEVALWKRFVPTAAPPRLLEASFRFRPVPGKVVVDLFWNRFCLTSEIEAQRVREVVALLGDGVALNEHDATDPEVLRRHQVPRGIFVQGDRITWGFEAPREGLREAILQARGDLRRV